jgi:hypothetical protein
MTPRSFHACDGAALPVYTARQAAETEFERLVALSNSLYNMGFPALARQCEDRAVVVISELEPDVAPLRRVGLYSGGAHG